MKPIKLPAGQKISAPGCYDLSMDEYHGQPCDGPSISSSGLRTIWAESPAHFWLTSSLNPHREEPGERPYFSLGRAAHHLLFLGRKGFDEEFVIRPAQWSDWRTKDAKEWRADQIAAGKTIITDAELEQIAGMARSLAEHPMVKPVTKGGGGILDGAVERSLIFKDEHTGIWLKSRPDNIPNSSGDFADLKTSESVSTVALQRSLKSYHYHMQGALVAKASKAVLGVTLQSFSLVWVEKKPPYCVRVTEITPEDLVRGRMQVDAATEMFARCLDAGRWPGPGGEQQDAEYLGMDEFTRKRIDEQLELLKGGSGAVADEAAELHMELS